MFDESIIVQSAVSAFNNAALRAPAFLWWGLLAVPLFVLVYLCGDTVAKKIGWTRQNIMRRASGLAVGFALLWTVLFGGNYAVLRDGVSLLPFVTATILCVSVAFITTFTRDYRLPRWRELPRRGRVFVVAMILCALGAVGLSDMHAWWGPLLQIGAVLAGIFIGRRIKGDLPHITTSVVILTAVTTAILMQPEFFRFGQLGNLTPLHLLALIVFGAFAVATIALRNVNARGRIHHSAYVKLKWMARFVCLFGALLFMVTESVPVYFGMLGAFGAMFAMSVWHARELPSDISEVMFTLTLIAFGVITTMPAVTAIGLVYLSCLGCGGIWSQLRFLL